MLGKDFFRFDVDSFLFEEVELILRYEVYFGLQVFLILFLIFLFNWVFGGLVKKLGFWSMIGFFFRIWMFVNLSCLCFDKFSDEYFVEWCLNGFNLGKLNFVIGQEW